MKSTTMAILSVLAFAIAAPAQEQPTQQKMEQAQQRLAELNDRLKLTPDQVDKVKPVLTEEMAQLKALRDNPPGRRMKMARDAKHIRSQADDKLKTILTKDQMAELKKYREERRDEMKDARKK